MSHSPFLKALTTKRIPMNRRRTNPQCILVVSPKKIKLRIQKKTPKLNSSGRLFFFFVFCFFFCWQVFFCPLLQSTNKSRSVSFYEVGLSAGSGRWHLVIQLLFPLACAGCAPLSSADRAISSPRKPRRKIR